MSKKDKLLSKLFCKGIPKNFTVQELNQLMSQCNCEKFSGGRGSSIAFYHTKSRRILEFDGPHPEKDLYMYQVKMVRKFLKDIGEV